jgi:uncharacterized membrane protein YfbV (UPF0208 family)
MKLITKVAVFSVTYAIALVTAAPLAIASAVVAWGIMANPFDGGEI